MKTYGGVEVYLHVVLNLLMEVSGELHIQANLVRKYIEFPVLISCRLNALCDVEYVLLESALAHFKAVILTFT
jgi:hypothetical protein